MERTPLRRKPKRGIPEKLGQEMSEDPYYQICARENGDCGGRMTWEHVFLYAGKQIQEKWAIIPLCWRHHLGDKLVKKINREIALRRATLEDLGGYPNLIPLKQRLHE